MKTFFRVGFPEMPDINITVTPTYGAKQYAYVLLQDFLAAKLRAEFKVRNSICNLNHVVFIYCFVL